MSECSKGPCVSNDDAYRTLRSVHRLTKRKLEAAERDLKFLPGLREDAAIIDWLSKNHVSITYYRSSRMVEITWFIERENNKCTHCHTDNRRGTYPNFRGKDLREAVRAAMESEKESDSVSPS